ncbi:MAG: polyphosphate kinase 2 family protein [bacterium]|nr:polyphosphate kinase 2 family protein [bacterium]
MIPRRIVESLRVEPGKRLHLADRDPGWALTKELRTLGKEAVKERAERILADNLRTLTAAQALLWASNKQAVLMILQGMDAAGKDGIVKHVMSGMNPQGCDVHAFKQPTPEEIDHDFLWRCQKRVPERGRIGIFNRSWYEDVLVLRVHPERVPHGALAGAKSPEKFWEQRYDSIREYERHLARNGTTIVKFFLHISKDEQKRRFLERLDDPDKQWKFSVGDITERGYWDDYQRAYELALSATSTKHAPWYVVPADHKWIARAVVADVLATAIGDLDLAAPRPDKEQKKRLAEAKRSLLAE